MNRILEVASKLPTGLIDPNSLMKMGREQEELIECIANSDLLGAIMEAADVMYYAHKAAHNGLCSERERDQAITVAARSVILTVDQLEQALVAKYGLRALPGNPKDDAKERVAVLSALKFFVAGQNKAKVIAPSPLGFPGATIQFEEMPFPADLTGMTSYVGHPATRSLLEALGAQTDASNNGNPGRWQGPAIGESYLAIPLASNAREGGYTKDVAIDSVSALRAIRCTRIV